MNVPATIHPDQHFFRLSQPEKACALDTSFKPPRTPSPRRALIPGPWRPSRALRSSVLLNRNAADDAVTADRQTPPMDIEAISNAVIGAAIRVHSALGPGLLESTYRVCLAHELHLLGLDVREEASLPVAYRGIRIDAGYRIDLLVDDKLIVELKVVERIRRVHEAQLLAYLKLSGRAVGLLINFHVPQLRLGIKRLVNNYEESSTTTRPNDAT